MFRLSWPLLWSVAASMSSSCSAWTPDASVSRRDAFNPLVAKVTATFVATATLSTDPFAALAKCTDIDSCREIGDAKVAQDMKENPITKLTNGVQYRVLRPGSGEARVDSNSVVDLAYSVSESNGRYLYSQGMGYEKISTPQGKQPDLGLDSILVHMGSHNEVPVGLQEALFGMRRGERRRVSVPAAIGFDTSNWQPAPPTQRGALALRNYQNLIRGQGGAQLAFPAETVWDVEVLRIKK